jgi:hypothetical protein
MILMLAASRYTFDYFSMANFIYYYTDIFGSLYICFFPMYGCLMFIMVPLPADCSSQERVDYDGSDGNNLCGANINDLKELDDDAGSTDMSLAIPRAPELALFKYFLVFDVNGTEIRYNPEENYLGVILK